MNTNLDLNFTSSARSARTRSSNASPDSSSPYASPAETRRLLASGLAARSARLAASDMVSTDEAGKLANASRVTINAWIAKGRCIGLSQTKRGYRVPSWQFEPRMWELLSKLAGALGSKDGWDLLSFLETSHGGLEGRTPRAAVEQGDAARVLELAAHEGT